ncbi:hypothetical protein [Streptomyces sp. NPDC059076]|uniref:hypothetical protein n=1 Tax=unclassified Streptomyces TaxID=2593676 RepID=UPI0036A1FD0C
MTEHPMDRTLRLGATRIPDTLRAELHETTLHGTPKGWPTLSDRDADTWVLTTATHHGDTVMLPHACDMEPMLRAEVEQHFGPLTEEPTR